jgi:hypothetical protein
MDADRALPDFIEGRTTMPSALLGCAGLVTVATLAALASPAVRSLTAPALMSGPPWPATETD